jgi:signal transduction histidine kinase
LERICRIVKPVNQYSRNGSKSFVEMNLNELLSDVLVLMTHKLKQEKIRLVKKFDSSLPVISARTDLDQVCINLIKNALEAMEPGGTLEISTSFDDTGCGVPEEVLSRLGERGVTTKENGTGLGLSICRDILRQHDGELEIQSERGAGSTCTVRLPLKKKEKGN